MDRVNFSGAFVKTGMDYTGHFYIVDETTNSKRKVYLLIFTCLVTLAVHIEVVTNMSTVEFILAFIRFTNRYIIPSVIYPDNASTFIAAGRVLKQHLMSDAFKAKFIKNKIDFRRIPVHAPWYGGTWERMIGTIKNCLNKLFRGTVVSLSS